MYKVKIKNVPGIFEIEHKEDTESLKILTGQEIENIEEVEE